LIVTAVATGRLTVFQNAWLANAFIRTL